MSGADLRSDGRAAAGEAEAIAVANGEGSAAAEGSNAASKNAALLKEYDLAKSKLLHQEFNPADYPDPLLPRDDRKHHPFKRQFPPDAEQRLRDVMDAATAADH